MKTFLIAVAAGIVIRVSKLGFIGYSETSVKVTRTRCVIHCLPHITHKKAVLMYLAADAWKRVIWFCFSIISLRRKSYRLRSDIHLCQLV